MRPDWTYQFLGNIANVYLDRRFRGGMQLKIRIYPCNIRVINANDSHKYIVATSLEIVYEVNNSDSGEGAQRLNPMKISQSLRKFAADESGVTAIEYGILAAAMAAAVGYIFSSDGAFISALRDKFQQIADDISGAGKNVSIK